MNAFSRASMRLRNSSRRAARTGKSPRRDNALVVATGGPPEQLRKNAKGGASGAKAHCKWTLHVGAEAPLPKNLPFPANCEGGRYECPMSHARDDGRDYFLVDGEFFDDAENIRGGNVVEGMLVFLLEAPAQVFGGDITCFAIAQVAAGPFAKGDEAWMRKA